MWPFKERVPYKEFIKRLAYVVHWGLNEMKEKGAEIIEGDFGNNPSREGELLRREWELFF